MDPELEFIGAIDQRLSDLSKKINQLRQIDPLIQKGLITIGTAFLHLEEKCKWLRKERKKHNELLPEKLLPKRSEYDLLKGGCYPPL